MRLFFKTLVVAISLLMAGAVYADRNDYDPVTQYPTHFEDYDGDGYTVEDGDCDDIDPLEYPGQKWYKDLDDDGFSDGTFLIACLRPKNYKVATELTRITGELDDLVPDPPIDSSPTVSKVQPTILIVNNQVTLYGSAFGSFQGSAYVNFHQNVEAVKILLWNDSSIVCELPLATQRGCVEVVTVMGESNCVDYVVGRAVPWLLLLSPGT